MSGADEASVELVPATGAAVEWVGGLLEDADLPTDDLAGPEAAAGLTLYVVRAEPGRVGCIGVERYGDAGLLRSAVVRDQYRGEGYGRAAVRAVETAAREDGLDSLSLLTTTGAGFFEQLGYERVERAAVPETVRQSAEFTELCPDTATVMHRRL